MATRTPDRTGAPPSQRSAAVGRSTRRRFRTLNLTVFLPLMTAVGALLVARQAQTWPQACALGLGVLAALLAFERWTAGDLGRVALPCLCVTAAVWPYGVLAVDGSAGAAYWPLALVGSLVVPQLPRSRGPAAVALVGYVVAVGLLGMLLTTPAGAEDLVDHVILPGGVTAVLVGVMFPNQRFYDVVADLEAERERDAELAVMRERMRFASDLHDIQGHTLHVVKLKVALAQRLVRTDTDRAEQELREVHELVGDTIARTRELAYGQRELNLAAELENARNLLAAAGIRVVVERRGDTGTPGIELLGQVLRETTTNVLRHSRATEVSIALDPRSITVVNDGVLDEAPPELRGLAALAHRVAEQGGRLTVRQADGRFRTAATFPSTGARR